MNFKQSLVWLLLLGASLPAVGQDDTQVSKAIDAIRSVGAEGAGYEQAIPAATRLRRLTASQVPLLLDGLEDANPVAENWLRGVVFDVVRKSDGPSMEMLESYAMKKENNPIGRGLAMELLQKQSPEKAGQLIDQCMEDASLPLREMAVERAIERANANEKENEAQAKQDYRAALASARHPRQLSRIIAALEELGETVNPADAFTKHLDKATFRGYMQRLYNCALDAL